MLETSSMLNSSINPSNSLSTSSTSSSLPFTFESTSGLLSIFGNSQVNTLREWVSQTGYFEFNLDGNVFSSDPLSGFFTSSLTGATKDNVNQIRFDGGEGRDTLILGNQELSHSLNVSADDDILINGNIAATGKLSIFADTLNIDGASITSKDSDKGGTVELLGKQINLTGAKIDASGTNGGGKILIGGDYQGKGTVPNAITTTIDSLTTIKADALQTGNGGKVIVWADDTTKYSGNISAKGGAVSGDGGFAEVSGKQNLSFQGLANLSAANGEVGTLLLDPDIVIISDAAPLPSDPPEPLKIQASTLQQIAGNVSVVATNTISLLTSLNFVKPGNAITFTAGSVFYGTGDISALVQRHSIILG